MTQLSKKTERDVAMDGCMEQSTKTFFDPQLQKLKCCILLERDNTNNIFDNKRDQGIALGDLDGFPLGQTDGFPVGTSAGVLVGESEDRMLRF